MEKEYTSGVPLGGLGCGKIELCPDGAFRHITTHNNIDMPFSSVDAKPWPETVVASNRYTPEGIKGGFLFASVEGEGGRILKAAEDEFFDCSEVEELGFVGLFPCATLKAPQLGQVDVEVEAFSPLIPQCGEPKDSSLPTATFIFRATNNEAVAKRVSAGLSFPNVIGVGGYPNALIADVRGNKTDSIDVDGAVCLRYGHEHPKVDRRLNGEYVMLASKDTGAEVSWVIGTWNDALWNYVAQKGELTNSKSGASLGEAGSVAPGSTGAMCVSQTLQPGESFEVPIVLSWYFPDMVANAKPEIVSRNAYAKHFTDALGAARYALENVARLHTGTKAWQNALLDSSLPQWLSYKLINNLFPMSACSMYLSDGRFGINEAPTHMGGCMGTIDQRSACATPYVMLLPEIAKSELKQFGDQQIGPDHPKRFGKHWNSADGSFGLEIDRLGAIKHDLGWDQLEEGGCGSELWCTLHWPDLSAVFVLQCYQQIIWTGDRVFLDEVWPRIKQALEFHKRLDQDGDGLADLWGPGSSTFDNDQFPYYGACTFVATLYLAALKAAIRLAEFVDEPDTAAQLRADFDKAQASTERLLWNQDGGFYNSWADENFENWKDSSRAHEPVSENSMLSSLAGVWFARMLELGPILDEARVDSALDQLYQRNVAPNEFCAPNEVKPDGSISWSWPYYGEAYFAANSIYHCKVEQGIEMVRKFNKAAFEKNHSHWDLPLSWEGDDNSNPWWGRWYMTNPSSWNVLLAITDVHYNALEKSLSIDPAKLDEMESFTNVPVFLPGLRASLSMTESELVFKVEEADSPLQICKITVPESYSVRFELNGELFEISTDGKLTSDLLLTKSSSLRCIR